ncbi:MAG: ribosomal protein S18-alanine N-acetyltransferase [Dehalococcoidia bacterium]|nr:ribosomal protein S18-alanine N-acetyltransferase [Dehalococcoidia bacterium]
MRYLVEPMQAEDIDEIIEIEKEAFTVAWSEAAYRRELEENRMARYMVLRELPEVTPEEQVPAQPVKSDVRRLLAESLRRLVSPPRAVNPGRGQIIGYAGLWLVVDEAHLTTIAVRAGFRGRGFGELLLIKELEVAKQADAGVMTLEVRVSNAMAQALYRKYGFGVAGQRRRYYSDNNEDALIMTTGNLFSSEFTARFETLKDANASRTGILDPQVFGS